MQKLKPILPLGIFMVCIALWLLIEPGATLAALGKARSIEKPDITATTFDDLVSSLLAQSDAVVFARVHAAESSWDEAHAIIQTTYTFDLLQNLLEPSSEESAFGLAADTRFQVVTDGGFLENEALGLWVSHGATFSSEEIVLLFLQANPVVKIAPLRSHDQNIPHVTWQIVGGELGKYTVNPGRIPFSENDIGGALEASGVTPRMQYAPVNQELLVNEALGIHVLMTDFLRELEIQVAGHGRKWNDSPTTLAAGASTQPATDTSPPSTLDLTPHDDPPRWLPSGLELLVKVNVNSVQITEVKAAVDLFMAIQRAMRTWSLIPSVDFTILYDGETSVTTTGYNGENEIVFMQQGSNKPLGQAQIWYTAENVILEVDMWLNDDYQFSVADEPNINEIDLESVVLHELGHWAPLGHSSNPAAVMYSVLGTTEVKRDLYADDINALMALYPCDLVPCVHEYYLGEAPTPTPRPTSTPSPTPTNTPTPTLVPTQPPPTGVDVVYLPFVVR